MTAHRIAILAVLLAACGGDGVPHSEFAASPACEQFVRARLNSPSTAEFQPFTQQDITHMGDGRYILRFHVDAQNGFGAMIRGEVYCETTYDPTRSGYQLDSLAITQ